MEERWRRGDGDFVIIVIFFREFFGFFGVFGGLSVILFGDG